MNRNAGFTLMELLVVIAVIGILATVLVTSTSSARVLAEDAVRKADSTSIAKALFVYNLKLGNWIGDGSGCGYQGNGNGWFNHVGPDHPKSIATCLLENGFIPEIIIDPSKGTVSDAATGNAYMKYSCTENSKPTTYVYAKLSSVPQSSTATDGTCCPTCDTSYGMNYFIKVD